MYSDFEYLYSRILVDIHLYIHAAFSFDEIIQKLIISDIRDFDEFETDFHDILHTVNPFIYF